MNRFERYFDSSFIRYAPKSITISDLAFKNGYLISGDFYGIQKFLFDNLSTKNAAKVLRAKSAYVQLYTIVLARYICHRIGISEEHIISTNAGKFEILAPDIDPTILSGIQDESDQHFIHHFFGLSGASICAVSYTKEEFESIAGYKSLRARIASQIEKQKYDKFKLGSLNSPIIDSDQPLTNKNLCTICNLRAIKHETCDICERFITLGKLLASAENRTISNADLKITFGDFRTVIELDTQIRSYTSKNSHNRPATFAELSGSAKGTPSLGVLKADVDGMGNFLLSSDVTDSFENFDLFSKTIDAFFSLHTPDIMQKYYPNTYTVFAGGDDLFIIGAWNEILELSRSIRAEFVRFTKAPLSLSFGVAIVKENTPVSFMASTAERYLESSKEMDGKDAITLFGMPIKWEEYLSMKRDFEKIVSITAQFPAEFNTAFWYRLIEFCDMRENMDKEINNALWRSKLSYTFKRNIIDKQKHFDFSEVIKTLNDNIERYRGHYKAVVFEELYKYRQTH